MHFRHFGMIGQVSALGFGCMRFPVLNDDVNQINEPKAIDMLRYAIDNGVNYIDTAYPYHGQNSEIVVGKALHDGYRQKVMLATKMPCWLVEKEEDFDTFLDEQLVKLQTDVIDVYLLHALWRDRWKKMQQLNVFDWIEKALKSGKIRHIGFSFHDTLDVFKDIVDAYDWDVCQIQYNILSDNVQAGTEGLKYAAQKGIAVVAMEPLLGGSLAFPPPAVHAALEEAEMNPVDLALRWLWDKPEISVVLSGMSTTEQLDQNLRIAGDSDIGVLSKSEKLMVHTVQEIYNDLAVIPCTKCGYCMPCPNGLDIPRNFELYNQAKAYDNPNLCKSLYSFHLLPAHKAEQCIDCKECEELCPQQIKIGDWMPQVHEELQVVS